IPTVRPAVGQESLGCSENVIHEARLVHDFRKPTPQSDVSLGDADARTVAPADCVGAEMKASSAGVIAAVVAPSNAGRQHPGRAATFQTSGQGISSVGGGCVSRPSLSGPAVPLDLLCLPPRFFLNDRVMPTTV